MAMQNFEDKLWVLQCWNNMGKLKKGKCGGREL